MNLSCEGAGGSAGGADDPPETGSETTGGLDENALLVVGARCLISVTGQRFLVEIQEVGDGLIRVSFPGIDYPVEGMLLQLEFHDHLGVTRFHGRVVDGPHKEGDGILLETPAVESHQQHRDTFRVDAELNALLTVPETRESHSAIIRNLSTGGALIESEAQLNTGDLVEVRLDLSEGAEASVTAEILYVSAPLPDDGSGGLAKHQYGTRFEGFEPGAGQTVTQFIWDQLRKQYPSIQ